MFIKRSKGMKMGFNKKGEAHYNGVKLERQIVHFINDSYNNNKDVLKFRQSDQIFKNAVCIHIGGTKEKSDAIFICSRNDGKGLEAFTISIKRKLFENGKPKGTFDMIHTSLKSFNENFKIFSQEKIEKVYKWLDSKKTIIKTAGDVDKIRDGFASLLDALLRDVEKNAEAFVKLMRNEFIKTDILIVGKVIKNSQSEQRLEIYGANEKDIKMFDQEDLYGNRFSLKKLRDNKDAQSRAILVTTADGQEFKTPFRIRLGLNNGLSAYYGKSDANKNSYLDVKIQVDGVVYIMEQMARLS